MLIHRMLIMSHIELRKGWHHEHTLLNDQTKECLLDHFLNVSGSLNANALGTSRWLQGLASEKGGGRADLVPFYAQFQ